MARVLNGLFVLFMTAAICAPIAVHGQRERQIQPAEEAQYGRRFFVQLRGVFGRFRDSDLQRAFEAAQPIQCSELVNDKGEWRTVAFFNEKRELGDWYRSSFEEVKSDLTAFIFKGVCRGERGPVQLTTKFPVSESIEAYGRGRIELDEVEINVNAPVSVFFDSPSRAYTFDLPYLFLLSRQEGESIYSLAPPRLAERDKYATDVMDHWACKSVSAEAVTYRFLICRTTTVSRNPALRNENRTPAFGASAYFILSDGKEASSSVKLSFSDGSDTTPAADPLNAIVEQPWQVPDSDERVVNLARNEFRIRFDAAAWAGRLGSAGVLSQQRLSTLESSTAGAGADSCVWLPDAASGNTLFAKDPETLIRYSLAARDQDSQSGTSIVFDMKTPAGIHLGTLRCLFPRSRSAMEVDFGRWTSIVGGYLTLEVR